MRGRPPEEVGHPTRAAENTGCDLRCVYVRSLQEHGERQGEPTRGGLARVRNLRSGQFRLAADLVIGWLGDALPAGRARKRPLRPDERATARRSHELRIPSRSVHRRCSAFGGIRFGTEDATAEASVKEVSKTCIYNSLSATDIGSPVYRVGPPASASRTIRSVLSSRPRG